MYAGVIHTFETNLKRMATGDLLQIHNTTGFEEFIIGGSQVSIPIQKTILLIFDNDEMFKAVELKANDIDVVKSLYFDY